MEAKFRGERRPLRKLFAPLILVSELVLVGCHTLSPPKPLETSHYRSPTGENLASIHLATILVWPWDNVSRAIQPQFTINVAAPSAPIAVTSEAQSRYSQETTLTLGAQYGVGLHSGLPPSSPSQGANGSTGPSGNSTGSKGGGKQDAAPTGNNNSSGQNSGSDNASNSGQGSNNSKKTPASNDGASSQGNGTVDKGTGSSPALSLADAITQLQMANALYQEAGLLNNFTNGLIQRRDYIPYIIRMQLTVLPYHRQEPYDLFLTMKLSPVASVKAGFVHSTATLPPDSLIVIPLLVTDSIEESQQNIAIDELAQLQTSLGAGVGPVALTAGYGNVIDSLNSSLSNRPNSLFSIGKIDDTTLEIRVGANRFGNDFELEPRTHSISFVALLNRNLFSKDRQELSQEIKVDVEPFFRDALFSDPQTKGDVKGKAISDSFVLESSPALSVTSTQPASEVWCPPDQTVVVMADETSAQGAISGVRDWGNRAAQASLIGFLNDDGSENVSFASAFSFRDSTGVIPIHFGPVTHLPTKKPIKKWQVSVLVDKLRTDATYTSDNPWITCQNLPATVVAAPKKATPPPGPNAKENKQETGGSNASQQTQQSSSEPKKQTSENKDKTK